MPLRRPMDCKLAYLLPHRHSLTSGPGYAAAAEDISWCSSAGLKPGGGLKPRHTTNASMLLLRLERGLAQKTSGKNILS